MVRKITPLIPAAESEGLDWPGIQALRFLNSPSLECVKPSLSLHALALITRPPRQTRDRMRLHEASAVDSDRSMVFVPSTVPVRWRWTGTKDSFHLYLDPELITRVAAESFDMSLELPPLEVLNLPDLRTTMQAFDAELTRGARACRLLVESLSTMLAVQLIRHFSRPRSSRQDDAALPRRKLDAVVDFVTANLDAGLSLTQMAAVAFLSPYHFARQFKIATGLPPHKYVVARRVERAQQLLREDRDFTLADVAVRSGFCDPKPALRPLRRIVGMTPRQFQLTARIA